MKIHLSADIYTDRMYCVGENPEKEKCLYLDDDNDKCLIFDCFLYKDGLRVKGKKDLIIKTLKCYECIQKYKEILSDEI